MRFARFVHPGGVSFGVVEGDGSSGLTVAEIDSIPFNEVRFTGQRWALADIRLLAPIFSSKVIGVGRNYADHAAEMGNEVPKEPLIFIKPSTSVIGPNDAIRIPSVTQRVDEEAELAVVIGATGARRVDRAGAQKAIFGYTVGNDVTARDLQKKDPQWTRAKGFDSFCPIGPWIETDLDVSDIEVRCEVGRDPNAMEVRQIGRTKDMVFDVPTLISYVSHVMTLLPGDIILTGTPAGVSQIVPGDTVSVSIQGIGELRNPVVSLD
ncbi:fumarylacetoacetate hydrolase family protein [Actinoplanes derwentensis]|uniref:fumarylacetoacetate hydrolase family protein n=1 Tax=Actinoplanes derwentensis TaxID=113562 RepID=UPI0018D488B6|nr:fumarylacetoacetate hydrolase family protein [Actinoplanes derwentensis]GID86025.1 2-hydroxyhepta-2,4-diene-1,7-dioate isomerase [Actinoplanes derwentensis]